MFDEVRLVDVMAESLGIKRIKGEGGTSIRDSLPVLRLSILG